MGATVTSHDEHALLDGGPGPLGASYGKMMMWFFIVSDALTFSGFLAAYGFQDLNSLKIGQLPTRCSLTFLFYMVFQRLCIMLP